MKYPLLLIVCILLLANCFETNTQKSTSMSITDEAYIEQGKKIAAATFSTLGRNLQAAMKEGGVSNAVKYCNLTASPLVDSLEQVYKVEIKRTSTKLRNPQNKANKSEMEQLIAYENQIKAGEKLGPILHDVNNHKVFHSPIHVMPLCEKCHGKKGETLNATDYTTIKELYPEDMAIGYTNGDLRGMWSITFME